jgi:hypothetical protein
VEEHGGRIVTDAAGKRKFRTGSGGGGSMQIPAAEAGDVTLGSYHTHPYSRAEGSHLGVGFSWQDIEMLAQGNTGDVQYVGAGSCYFVVDTVDKVARESCKSKDFKAEYTNASAAGGFKKRVERSVKAMVAGCGMCFYKVCRPTAAKPVPKVAELVK